MRFLMVISAYPPHKNAGMEQGCRRLSEALARRGHSVIVLTQTGNAPPSVREEAENLKICRVIQPIALGPLWGVTYMTQLRRWGARLAAEWDFCLCHKLYLHSAVFQSLCKNLGKIYCNRLANTGAFSDIEFLRQHKGGALLLRKSLEADGFFCLSKISRGELIREGVAEEKIHPYRNFVDLDKFSPSRERLENREFLYLGRFHEQKNLPLLLESFARLWRSHPEVRLRLVGKGPEDNYIRTLVRQSPASEAIRVDDWTDDPVSAYRNAWAVVTASNAEGLSNVLVEALACGVPVITSDVSGAREALDPDGRIPEIIDAGTPMESTGGYVYTPGDGDALVEAMKQIAISGEHRDELGIKARQQATETFSEDRTVEEFLRGAQAIVDSRKPVR